MQPPSGAVPSLEGISASEVPAGTWVFDPDRSSLEFVARHFVVSKVRGHFPRSQGTMVVGADLLDTTIEATAEAASVETGDPARDDHLRSPDFFDSERWPTLTLSGRVVGRSTRGHLVHADLTIRDQTRLVEFDVLIQDLVDVEGGQILTATAYASVNRKDFGLRWNATIETGGVVVADHVDLVLELVAVRSTS